LARGSLAYVDCPTYERTRHTDSVTSGTRHARVLAERAGDGEGEPEDQGPTGARLRELYFGRWMQMQAFARVLLARGGEEASPIEPRKERALRHFVAADRSLVAAARLGLRGLRPFIGRNETLGRERALAAAAVRQRLGRLLPRRGT
jgi:hypothetical protein